jgi:hypothetical protein
MGFEWKGIECKIFSGERKEKKQRWLDGFNLILVDCV